MRVADLNRTASNVPRIRVTGRIPVKSDAEVSAYRQTLPRRAALDALLINRRTPTLLVGFHGALARSKYTLPRFEWMRSLMDMGTSAMFFSDPGLHLGPRLELAWFTGWRDCDVPKIVADWITGAAAAIGARQIILFGSSGGGFAALQISSFIPNSIAVAFNGQTDISAYRVQGVRYEAQRRYLRAVWPEVFQKLPDAEAAKISPSWKQYMDDRVSAVDRYRTPQPNYVFMVQNREEFHYEDHYEPLVDAMTEAGIGFRLHTKLYRAGPQHVRPPAGIFSDSLREAMEFSRVLPSVGELHPQWGTR